jgi:hypothetical protein
VDSPKLLLRLAEGTPHQGSPELRQTMTNYAQLGEKLLAPHGLQVGLEFPDHRELGDDATCACESEEVKEQAIPVAAGLEGGNTD